MAALSHEAWRVPWLPSWTLASHRMWMPCDGGDGHAYTEPTVRCSEGRDEGLRALAVALARRFPVQSIHRYWDIIDGAPSGPDWEMTFWHVS